MQTQNTVIEEIEEELNKLERLCNKYQIPMMSAIAIENETGSDTKYIKKVITPFQCQKELTKDYITPNLVLFNGDFKVVPNKQTDVFEPSELFGDEENE